MVGQGERSAPQRTRGQGGHRKGSGIVSKGNKKSLESSEQKTSFRVLKSSLREQERKLMS